MENIKKTVIYYIKSLINKLEEIAILLLITSSFIAIRSIFSTEPQDCLFWAWSSLCLACSFILHRYSLMVNSMKCLLLSLIEMFIILVVSGHYVFGIQLLPRYTGPGLCAVMLLYYAVSLCVIIPERKNYKWTKTQKAFMVVSLGIAILGAVLAIFVPRWVIILMLNVATAISMLFVREKRKVAQ